MASELVPSQSGESVGSTGGSRQDRSGRDRSGRIRRRRFALTLNNPTASECAVWRSVLVDGNKAEHAKDLSFMVVQSEVGNGTDGTPAGTYHYQCYVEFKKAVEWSAVKKIFGERIHIENARASAAANIRYCTKRETRVEGGDLEVVGLWGKARKGGDVAMAAIKILNGAKLEEIVDDHPGLCLLQMPRIESFIAHVKGPRSGKPKVKIFYGKTGCGKSQFCVKEYGTGAYWVPPPDSGRVWFGHYMGQDTCIFDDFHEGWFTLPHFLRIMDSTPLMVAPKNHQVPFNSENLIFSSNVDPRDWYSGYDGKQEHKDALERRVRDFAEIYDCDSTDVDTGCMGLVTFRKRVKRTERFNFRDDMGLNVSFRVAGTGDCSQGNGFNIMM